MGGPAHHQEEPPEALDATVTTAEVAVNVRAISVHIRGAHEGRPEIEALLTKVDKIVHAFLEKHWPAPRRIGAIQPLSYVLFQAPDDPTFAEDAEAVRNALEQRLFGDKAVHAMDVGAVLGPRAEIEQLAAEDEIEFVSVLEEAAPEDEPGDAPQTLRPIAEDGPAAQRLKRVIAWRDRIKLYATYNVAKTAVVSYAAELPVGGETGHPARHEDLTASLGDDIVDFELAALDLAAKKVAEQLRKGAVSYCAIPLSYATLHDRKRLDAYFAEVERRPEDALRFLAPSVFGGPMRVTPSVLADIAGRLKKHFTLAEWRTVSCSLALEPFENARIFVVTLVRPAENLGFNAELDRLAEFTEKAKAHKVAVGVTCLLDRAELDAAIAGGAQFVSGPAVSGVVPSLVPRVGVGVDDLPLG